MSISTLQFDLVGFLRDCTGGWTLGLPLPSPWCIQATHSMLALTELTQKKQEIKILTWRDCAYIPDPKPFLLTSKSVNKWQIRATGRTEENSLRREYSQWFQSSQKALISSPYSCLQDPTTECHWKPTHQNLLQGSCKGTSQSKQSSWWDYLCETGCMLWPLRLTSLLSSNRAFLVNLICLILPETNSPF